MIVISSLDREAIDRYRVRVVAFDAGTPGPKSGVLDITVNVLDANDNSSVYLLSSVAQKILKMICKC